MNKIKVAFICHFSNASIREKLPLKTWRIRNAIFKSLQRPLWGYHDFAVWVDDFIEMFQKYPDDVDLHIISPHKGLKKTKVTFDKDNVHYHFYKTDGSLLYDLFCAKTKWKERRDYACEGVLGSEIINYIRPDLICLCGAENPEYGSAIFKIANFPIYLIPQTFLNDPKRISMRVASEYRIGFEKKVFAKVDYVSSKSELLQLFARQCNSCVSFLPMSFPSHQPPIYDDIKKEYDFVFYANNVMRNKGIEDVLQAISILKTYKESIKLKVIGGCTPSYRMTLDNMVNTLNIVKNVVFTGKLESINDVFMSVQMAAVVVVPGITAALNSTIRESMFMRMPVVCYETPATQNINRDKQCLITAKMEDVNDLADKMRWSIENEEESQSVANNGYEFASKNYGNDIIAKELLSNCRTIVKEWERE